MIGHRALTVDDYLGILRRRWWILVIGAVLGAPALYFGSLLVPSRYTSDTLVLVTSQTVPKNYIQPVVTEELSQRLGAMEKQILSRSRLQTVIERLGLYTENSQRVPMEDLVTRLQQSIKVRPVEPIRASASDQLPGFTVSVTAENPRLAQQICSEISSMFMQDNLQSRQQESENTTDFLSTQLGNAKAKLDEQDAKLADFKRRNIGRLPESEQTNLNLLVGLNTQLEATLTALNRAQQDKAFNDSLLVQQMATWQASQTDHNPQAFERQLADLQSELVTQQARYTDSYPEVIKTKETIAELKKKVAEASTQSAVDSQSATTKASAFEPLQVQALRTQIHQSEQLIQTRIAEQEQLQTQIKDLRARVQASPMVEQEYKELTRDYQTALDLYNDLLKKRDQSAMATDLERQQQGEQFRVLDAPSLPQKPSFPNRQNFALGGFAGGLALGLGLIVLLEMRDTTMRTASDVELLLQAPVMVLIPTLKPAPKSATKSPRLSLGAN